MQGHDIDPDDLPVSNFVATESGQEIDLNNLPGTTKVRLIQEGEMKIDAFIAPANLPGKKLQELRERHRESMEAALKKDSIPNEFQVGEMITFKGKVYEVLKVDSDRGVVIERKGKEVWVHHSKVTKG